MKEIVISVAVFLLFFFATYAVLLSSTKLGLANQNLAAVSNGAASQTQAVTGSIYLTVQPSKKAFGATEDIKFSTILENKTNKSATFTFNVNCQRSFKIGAYNSASTQVCSTSRMQFILKPGESKTFTDTLKRSTYKLSAGKKTITSTLIGYGSATAEITVNSTEQVATPVPVVIPFTFPVINPSPVTPPPAEVPSSSPPTVPPASDPGTPVTSTGNITVVGASTKAEYMNLQAAMETYASNAASFEDQFIFSAISEAAKNIVNETPTAAWNSETNINRPNTIKIAVQSDGASTPVVATRDSWFANAFLAVKNIFIAQSPQKNKYAFSGVTSSSNKCHRYVSYKNVVEGGVRFELSEKQGLVNTFKSLFKKDKYANSTEDFQLGMCSTLAVFDSLYAFDLNALNEPPSQSYAKQYAQPGFESGPSATANLEVLDSMIRRTKIKEGLSTSGETYVTDGPVIATMHTVFNEYGPADFTCSAIELMDPRGFTEVKNDLNSCKADLTLIYIVKDGLGHAEHIKKIDVKESTATVYTKDAYDQGALKITSADALKNIYYPPLERPENSYVFSTNAPDKKTALIGMFAKNAPDYFRKDMFTKGFKGITAMSCKDNSDVIRNLDNMDWVKLENQRVDELANFIAGSNAKYWLEWEKKTNPWYDPNDAPNFSTCKKADVGAALNTYNTKLRAWTIKWNKAAYENKGYLTKAKRQELYNERFWGAPGNASGSEHVKGFEGVLFDAVYKYSNCVDDKDRQLPDEIWKSHPEIGQFYDYWHNKGKTYYTPKIDEIKKTIKCEVLMK